jgi:hypothetical protein
LFIYFSCEDMLAVPVAIMQGVSGTLFFQGQRLFFHNATGYYGAIPLNVSGDIDLNPEDGEYRLSCQVAPGALWKLIIGVQQIEHVNVHMIAINLIKPCAPQTEH